MTQRAIPEKWQWFPESRYGMFIHWGPYASYGRGEQVLFREHLDQADYERRACAWNPAGYDASAWARVARRGGMKYAVLTTRHHDGYCLWDSKLTDYTSAAQVPGRDFVAEYVDAFRSAGLRVGLYYSLADWRVPAYFEGPEHNPRGWDAFRDYVHGQVAELLSNYGKIDVIWFDGAWPHDATVWRSAELVKQIRAMQPDILVNNRLGLVDATNPADVEAAGGSSEIGDFGTPEHHITADPSRLWESCQVSTWRLWGYARGERWRTADYLLDMLVESASKGGNLLLNVGPTEDGELPAPFIERSDAIGRWLEIHGECIYGSQPGGILESVTYGRQIIKGNNLYLVIRHWPGETSMRIAGLGTKVEAASIVTNGQSLALSSLMTNCC